ncbi:MAG TPA: hypothetical protein PJ988_01865, partial [Anaerolinea sp.]|nr:hypothetical protein [Anaerolinea sp.]
GQMELNVTVPPNAVALVSLPGSDSAPLEVGSGQWRWTYTYQNQDAAVYTLDDVVGEVMSDRGARAAVMNIITQAKPPELVFAILENEPEVTL